LELKLASWIFSLALGPLAAFSIPANASTDGTGGINAPEQRDKPYLILISIDGFRWDYQDVYETPVLDQIAENGVRADALIPVFPTLTFPNHYSIATGLYPANHGLLRNRFPSKDRRSFFSLRDREAVEDGSWYRGEPIWVAAEKYGMVSAAFFFVGTEADVGGIRLSYWNSFDESISGKRRVDQVVEWLAMPDDKRPHLITLYFEHVDTASHRAGPGSKKSVTAIKRVDEYLGRLLAGIDRLSLTDDVYIVVVSDHGQTAVNGEAKPFFIDSVANINDITVVDHGAAAFLYFPEPDRQRSEAIRTAINNAWERGRAMLRHETPDSWHVSNDSGFADIIVQADPGYVVYSSRKRSRGASIGDHGWAPEHEEMRGIFLANGPRLPKGKRIPAVNAVDVYPLMIEILEIPLTMPIDGDPRKLTSLLSPRAN
jgi:predicted AlkP superfamily pyrophosphatase or phosphodiesterase